VSELVNKINQRTDNTPHIEVQVLDVGSDNGLLHNTCRDIVAGAKRPTAILLVSVDTSKPDKPDVILCAHVSRLSLFLLNSVFDVFVWCFKILKSIFFCCNLC
jgi:hypothetical protein